MKTIHDFIKEVEEAYGGTADKYTILTQAGKLYGKYCYEQGFDEGYLVGQKDS